MAFGRGGLNSVIGLLAKSLLVGLVAFLVRGAMAAQSHEWQDSRSCHAAGFAPSSPEDTEVLAQLNFARAHPAAYAQYLIAFRAYYRGYVVYEPGRPAIETNEGVAAIDEAIDFMNRQMSLAPLVEDRALVGSATRFADEAGPAGLVGHYGGGGSSPGQRIPASCLGAGMIAEVISYGQEDAAAVVRQLIIDDGVADRSHRHDIFSPTLTAAGAGCGPHRMYGTMCVIDLAATNARRYAPGQ